MRNCKVLVALQSLALGQGNVFQAFFGPRAFLPIDNDVASTSNKKALKHVLLPPGRVPPSYDQYKPWYDSQNITFVSNGSLPKLQQDVKVEIFFLTKPVYGLVGRITGVWHAALGFRVPGGPSYVFEFSSIDFTAAIVFPDDDKTSPEGRLRFAA